MKKLIALIFVASVAARISDEKCKEYYKEDNNNNKNDDLINKYPYMGLLGYEDDKNKINYQCPATLISESYALTPAFCLTSPQGLPKHILVGTSNTNETSNQKLLEVTETLIHPSYSKSDRSFKHSLALVKFSPTLTSNDKIRPGCLYTKRVDDKESLVDLLWERSGLRRLLKVDSTIVPFNTCKENYKKQFTVDDSTHLCVRRKFDGEHVLHIGGTSHVIEDKIPKIVALDNFGPRLPTEDVPDVATNLYNYLDWIEENVWKK